MNRITSILERARALVDSDDESPTAEIGPEIIMCWPAPLRSADQAAEVELEQELDELGLPASRDKTAEAAARAWKRRGGF
jgi:hypothetical protein